MPVAIWNDQVYDSQAIYSGSCVNDVAGTMTLIYPGVCNKRDKGCDTGTTINLAFPADSLDPLATNFSKPSYNPIAQINQSVGKGGGGPPGLGGFGGGGSGGGGLFTEIVPATPHADQPMPQLATQLAAVSGGLN